MASTKFILREDKKNAKGECPIFLRITSLRKSSYKSTGIYVKPTDLKKTYSDI